MMMIMMKSMKERNERREKREGNSLGKVHEGKVTAFENSISKYNLS